MVEGKYKARGRSHVFGGKRWALIGRGKEAVGRSRDLEIIGEKVVDRAAMLDGYVKRTLRES